MTGHVQHAKTFRYTGLTAEGTGVFGNEDAQNHSLAHAATMAVWPIAAATAVLLALRFVFMLLGTNQNHLFINIIYTLSTPFVTPFFHLFGYTAQYDVSSFEYSTLVAIAAYGLIAWGLARLLTIKHLR